MKNKRPRKRRKKRKKRKTTNIRLLPFYPLNLFIPFLPSISFYLLDPLLWFINCYLFFSFLLADPRNINGLFWKLSRPQKSQSVEETGKSNEESGINPGKTVRIPLLIQYWYVSWSYSEKQISSLFHNFSVSMFFNSIYSYILGEVLKQDRGLLLQEYRITEKETMVNYLRCSFLCFLHCNPCVFMEFLREWFFQH